jgi:class 3 adenylate cyclase/tetratricopeptide (TPR) repeat protein
MTTLRRHVPELALDWVLDAPEQRWQLRDGTLCFADISGFTALAERLAQRGRVGGEELVETLGRVFADMLDIAAERRGALLKFGGDALLLFFHGEGHTMRAASAAVEMRQALRAAAKIPTSVGPLRLSMSVGLHSGPIHFFLVGSTYRELVLLGPGANTTVATENAANAGEILVSPGAAAALPATAVKARADGQLLLRWRRAPIDPDGRREPRRIDDALVSSLFPRRLGEHLAQGVPDPEHRVACIAFIRFSGTDAILAEQGADVLAEALQKTIGAIQTHLDEAGVTLLALDIDRDGGKLFLGSGVPHGHEDDEGVMLRALRQIADTKLPLPLQIGVNRGHVFAAEVGGPARAAYSAMGDTTNTAARITSKTPLGAIYAHPSVLDQSLTLYATRPAEALVLKGKKAPLVVYEVGDEIGQRRREGLSVETYIGRTDELRRLRAALRGTQNGNGSVIQLVGEAGTGKSRLLREAIAGFTPSAVLSMRAEPYGANSPYRMFRDPVRALLGVARADPATMLNTLVHRVARADPALVTYLGLMSEVVQIPIEPSAEVHAIEPRFRPERAADVLIRLLETTQEGPLVIIVDDAQWCDEASAHLLTRLAKACADRPWSMVVARRDVAGGFIPDAPLEIRLGPMEAAEIRAIVVAATEAAPMRPHETETIVQRAGGNPLFASEIVRAVREVGSLDAVPQAMEAALAAHVDALDPSARRTLRCAAVLGRSFSQNVLADVLQVEGVTFDAAALARLVNFLDADGADRLRFRSGLVRDTTYEGIAFRIRTRLHAAAGLALERLAADPDTIADSLALHFYAAGDFARAWRYARIAGDRARVVYANADAARLYELALGAARRTTGVAPAEAIQIWTQLGAARELNGMFEASLDAYRRALRLAGDDRIARADLLCSCATAKERVGTFASALSDLTRGRKLVDGLHSQPATQTRARLLSLTAMVRFGQDQADRAYRHAQLAIAEARRAGDKNSLLRALTVLELARLGLKGPGDGRHLREALSVAEQLGSVRSQASVQANLGFVCAHAGRWNEAAIWFSAARDAFLRSGDAVSAAFQATNLGEMLVKQRRFEEAPPILLDALRVVRASDWAEGVAMIELQLARIQIERGGYEAADEMLERVVAEFERLDKPMYALEASATRALGLCRAGKPAAALGLLTRVGAAARTNDMGLMRPVLAHARATALALLGRSEDAERDLADGLLAARNQGLPYEEAMLLLVRCDIARSRNQPPDPIDAEAVEKISNDLGIRPITEPATRPSLPAGK